MKSIRRMLSVLIISSVFVLLFATPLSILTVNAQPPPTALPPPPQATQTSPPLSTQQNMTQLNQSAAAPLSTQQNMTQLNQSAAAPLSTQQNMTQLNQSAAAAAQPQQQQQQQRIGQQPPLPPLPPLPPPQQQQQRIGQQPPQATQTSPPLSTQQNMTQLNQSTPQQIAPLNQLLDSEDFVASGTINSTIYTTNGNWEAIGIWTLSVSEGEVTSFDTDMAWNNGTSAHTHEFQNFEMDEDSDDISIDSEGGITIGGDMDIGTNGVVSWPSVPAEIIIQQAKIITISVDNEETDNHFGGQSVHGTVTSLTPCSALPGPNMQISTGACL
jgi:hypothetical protein